MKKMKKGFTIVELVIVIAVIGILAGVLIPTFASVATKAKKSAALQETTNALTVVLVDKDGALDQTYYFCHNYGTADESDDIWYEIIDGKLEVTTKPSDALQEASLSAEATEDLPENVTVFIKA